MVRSRAEWVRHPPHQRARSGSGTLRTSARGVGQAPSAHLGVDGAVSDGGEDRVERAEHGLGFEQLLLIAEEANPTADKRLLRVEFARRHVHRRFPVLFHLDVFGLRSACSEGCVPVCDKQVIRDVAFGAAADDLGDAEGMMLCDVAYLFADSDLGGQRIDPVEAQVAQLRGWPGGVRLRWRIGHTRSLPDRGDERQHSIGARRPAYADR
jgi:hypothetical protein